MEKLVARFKRFPIGKKQIWNKKRERLEEIILWDTKISKFTPLTRKDVMFYFNNIRPKNRELGEYCERCGVIIGEEHKGKKCKTYKGFFICEWCYNKKRRSSQEGTPDIEDIKRFGIRLI